MNSNMQPGPERHGFGAPAEERLGTVALTRANGSSLPLEGGLLDVPADGEVLELDPLPEGARFLRIEIAVLGENSQGFDFLISPHADGRIETGQPGIRVRFGLLPGVPSAAVIDLAWMDGHVLFPGSYPGQLKYVVHGSRIAPGDVRFMGLQINAGHEPRRIRVGELTAHRERPAMRPVTGPSVIDRFGQLKTRDWPGKTGSEAELRERLENLRSRGRIEHPDGRTAYGGDASRKLAPGTGRFRTFKQNERWYLLDPEGAAFFSLGVDCLGISADCRIDGIESWLDWLPAADDPLYGDCFARPLRHDGEETQRGQARSFSYMGANLRRVFGTEHERAWHELTRTWLIESGVNTIGNWSDPRLAAAARLPWVTQLPEFPTTETKIFRDFPDVFDPAYREDAARCAEALRATVDDNCLIGYFLRNEPGWAFVDGLNLADEVLRNPEPSYAKKELIDRLRERYGSLAAFNSAWGLELGSFEDLRTPLGDASRLSPAAREDQRRFSRELLRQYVGVPSAACRRVDPEHLNLGMRWAWISDPDLVSGWENFDVFSINCYARDPRERIRAVRELGVDLPVIIGEFHFGALDVGLTATGLEGVRTQADRGRAIRSYLELAASDPAGVGCHYFQAYDQFALGRFDGENYNIGLTDICFRPYEEIASELREAARRIPAIREGLVEPDTEGAEPIPMIAY